VAYVVDTNVLVRWVNRLDPDVRVANAALRRLHAQQELLHVTAQNLMEFWSVATRPVASNGLGRTPAQARGLVDKIGRLFPLLPSGERVFERWLYLVTAAAVSGRQVHDAHLAALMLVHGIERVLTFNVAEFARFQAFGVIAVHPKDV